MRCCSCGRKSLPIPGARVPAWPCRLLRPADLRGRTAAARTPRPARFRCRIPVCSSPPRACETGFAVRFRATRLSVAVSSTATATMSPASSVSVTWPPPMPSLRRTFSPRGEYTTSGRPQAFCTTPTSRIQMPCAKPVPMALTMASLAAKRIARKRSVRRVLASCARSAGISRRSTKWSPYLSNTFLTRAASSTSTPMPKIIGALPPSAPSCHAPPLRGRQKSRAR